MCRLQCILDREICNIFVVSPLKGNEIIYDLYVYPGYKNLE